MQGLERKATVASAHRHFGNARPPTKLNKLRQGKNKISRLKIYQNSDASQIAMSVF